MYEDGHEIVNKNISTLDVKDYENNSPQFWMIKIYYGIFVF